MKIIKKLHFVWVGDESKCPNNCIDTWRKFNPEWEIIIWGNDSLFNGKWMNSLHIKKMWDRELNGVADMMRWEILYHHGGFALDADSICLRKLEDWLFEPECFASWESEIVRPGLIAAGYVYSLPSHPFIGQIIHDIHNRPTVVDQRAWASVGPGAITRAWNNNKYSNLTIYPSHYFIPNHPEMPEYSGSGQVFARQFWASTMNGYNQLHNKSVEDLITHGLAGIRP